MPTNKKIVDPLNLPDSAYPIFINSIDLRGFMGFAIRAITGNVNHSMLSRRPGFVCTQSMTYKEIPLSVYLTRGSILKFWICIDMTEDERREIMALVHSDLRASLWRRMYDFPGVIGQMLGLRGFNIPWLNYCSERIGSKARVIIPDFPIHGTPEEGDLIFEKSPRMKVYGYWMGDRFVLANNQTKGA